MAKNKNEIEVGQINRLLKEYTDKFSTLENEIKKECIALRNNEITRYQHKVHCEAFYERFRTLEMMLGDFARYSSHVNEHLELTVLERIELEFRLTEFEYSLLAARLVTKTIRNEDS